MPAWSPRIVGACLLVMTFALPGWSTTYKVLPRSLSNGYSVAGGFITTNGTLGALSPSDIVDYEFNVAGIRFPFDLNPANPFPNLRINGQVIATPTEIVLPIDTDPDSALFNELAIDAFDNDIDPNCQNCVQLLSYGNSLDQVNNLNRSNFSFTVVDLSDSNPIDAGGDSFEPQQSVTIARVPEPGCFALIFGCVIALMFTRRV